MERKSSTFEGKQQSQCTNQNSFDDSTPKHLQFSENDKQALYINKLHKVGIFEVLQSLRKEGVLCDIDIETDDGTHVGAHKIVLASSSPYFRAKICNSIKSNTNSIKIRKLYSSALILIIDYIYTAQLMITEENVQILIDAARFLQLNDVQHACCTFLQAQLQPTNCLQIMALADNKDCTNLLSTTKLYILQHFADVVENDHQSLSLTLDEVIKFISNDALKVPSEKKVYEYVIKWINYDLKNRKQYLPKLVEHVRLPLISKEYLLNKVIEEPLIKDSSKCKDYIIEALHYHLMKSVQPDAYLNNIRTIPRRYRTKVFITFNEVLNNTTKAIIKWYDLTTTQWQRGPEISIQLPYGYSLSVRNNQYVYFVGGEWFNNDSFELFHVYILDLSLSTPHLQNFIPITCARSQCGVACLNNCLYAFGGKNGNCFLNSAEYFDFKNPKKGWQIISNMSTRRSNVGVLVSKSGIYVVGGIGNDYTFLKSVELYNPSADTWTPVANMCEYRMDAGVEVLNGIIYAVGGSSENGDLNSVEAYRRSTKVWTLVAPMHKKRAKPVVKAMEGLLYVFEGNDVEIYNPVTNHWSI